MAQLVAETKNTRGSFVAEDVLSGALLALHQLYAIGVHAGTYGEELQIPFSEGDTVWTLRFTDEPLHNPLGLQRSGFHATVRGRTRGGKGRSFHRRLHGARPSPIAAAFLGG
jgi:hypothetical protein